MCDDGEVSFMKYNDSPTDEDVVFPMALRFKSDES
jgi:hypothetical protein